MTTHNKLEDLVECGDLLFRVIDNILFKVLSPRVSKISTDPDLNNTNAIKIIMTRGAAYWHTLEVLHEYNKPQRYSKGRTGDWIILHSILIPKHIPEDDYDGIWSYAQSIIAVTDQI